MLQAFGDLYQIVELQNVFSRFTPSQQIAQTLLGKGLLHEVGLAVARAELVDRRDVRVAQDRCPFGRGKEPPANTFVGRHAESDLDPSAIEWIRDHDRRWRKSWP